ncbi:MAG: bifunctional ornithine acetyltransferase/N-acetylglutamate synthase [Treponema sp.]|nr:bifunctional ornithine acetyltransferase/N-acetylglutamate synthase [Treponema sp.]MCL2271322.1 bifunctional ornithine acetyltransferase/N-acetylglutamate synthase [Treponema sp.]
MKEISGGVCAPKGFLAGGIRCGIKESSPKNDLALVYSQKPCAAAAMFTQNKVKAACVTLTQENIAGGKIRAVIANSGNANACTGDDGMKAARRMAHLAADALSLDPKEVAVASTGVIGVAFPITKIENNIGVLKDSLRSDGQGHSDALSAIMTTDTRKKEIAVEISIDGKPVRIGAMAKGSGMIHPNMATMLCFITTDAAIEAGVLDSILRRAVKKSFNRLTVDGDTSTNDMVVIMANSEAGNRSIKSNEEGSDFKIFSDALEYVCIALARMMARDGEGATKLVTVTVTGAADEQSAETLAKSAASSNLVKTACFGADANWGRVLCALGYAKADFTPEKTDVSFKSRQGEIQVCKNGQPVSFSEETAKKILSCDEIEILISLKDGKGEASVWGCDLTYDYVKINGDYRS